MKRFRFSLQTVHNVREARRDMAEAELARAAAELRQAEAQLDAARQARLAREEQHAAALTPGALDLREIEFRVAYLSTLAARERDASSRVGQLEREHEEQRCATADAARDAEATANLRELHRARHGEAATRHAQNTLDEMATLAAGRRHVDER
jgi:flagellar export protein FliJ